MILSFRENQRLPKYVKIVLAKNTRNSIYFEQTKKKLEIYVESSWFKAVKKRMKQKDLGNIKVYIEKK